MANNISGNVSQLYRSVDNSRNVTSSNKAKGATNKEAAAKKTSSILDKFGESAKVNFLQKLKCMERPLIFCKRSMIMLMFL